MRKLFVLGVLIAVTLAVLGLGSASAGVPTPTPTSSPTPTATPTPTPRPTSTPTPVPGSSTITIRFVRDGEPVTFTGNREAIVADGVLCQFPEPAAPYPFPSELNVPWPMGGAEQGLNQPAECTKGPPTTIRFEFSSEFGLLVAEFVWNGADITIEVEVPPLATPTPSAPVDLPPGGGAPAISSSADLPVWAIVASGIAAVGAGVATVRFALRRRP